MCQVGTHLYKNGISIFQNLHSELEDIMKHKNYTCLEDFRGKLNTIQQTE